MHWFAVHVKPRHESRVFERLTGAGMEAFLPLVKRISQWKDRKKAVRFPLFPGYLFVRSSNTHPDRLKVLKTAGVVRLLGSPHGEPEAVPGDQVEALQRIIAADAPIDAYPYLREGQRVRIVRGPLAGIEGILEQKTGGHTLVLSIDILEKSASVSIDPGDVEPA